MSTFPRTIFSERADERQTLLFASGVGATSLILGRLDAHSNRILATKLFLKVLAYKIELAIENHIPWMSTLPDSLLEYLQTGIFVVTLARVTIWETPKFS